MPPARRVLTALALVALAGSGCGGKKSDKAQGGSAAAGTGAGSSAVKPGPGPAAGSGGAGSGSGSGSASASAGTGDSSGNREHAGEARPTAGPDLVIQVTGVAGESTFTGDKLAALPVVKAPSGDTETPGWSLVDVLHAAGIKDPKIVHLTDGEGASLRLEAADFDTSKSVLYLKLNRSGVVRFRVFRKVGSTWEVGGELRGLTKIHVVE